MKMLAAIVREAGAPLSIEKCEIAEPNAGEALIEVEACGVCHTDVAARDQYLPVPLPAVLGHEGVGRILKLGAGVDKVAVGDRVVVSFGSCGHCANCHDDAPSYCDHGAVYMINASRADGSSPISQNGKPISGHFFAQSTMASHAVVSCQNIVKLDEDFPAHIAAPLACGVQTGAGSVLLVMKPKPGKAIVILGCGTVGLSAIMAAKIAGCSTIIAVDILASRLELAQELGAHHIIQNSESIAEQLLTLGGVDYVFDTTGIPALASAAFSALKARGMLVCVGVAKPESHLKIDMNMLMATGRQVRGVIEGDAVPADFIPKLIAYYQQGLLPLDKLVSCYDFNDINQAIDDTLGGKVVKPVLMMKATTIEAE
ncbi:Aryl-alcohol dehydrogenase [Zhongshania aliphaticivorans]|uniref:Aryl-alcohol dehydrogenase n=1 Tax=Zhongshania aliphaticivorans TaxID=1470434 RepID=A0A5S9QHL3_9GAMM|nr:NAD(P)-dependent alcohol dehydrogenase [Zhongshania aliphaticivorans]CAA0110580.1 Aryl-alcohol dehydrogenase [Zhongshania aliphaticivorans]CAA0118196.1 Aryl-alcohol dehydrogenase [Zhongshania aliphaticivorans]CAA0122210.1 Aryl-alcohol dehydrogenase [Zhongshania aliphaticivorans]